jgi:hypothetical protein
MLAFQSFYIQRRKISRQINVNFIERVLSYRVVNTHRLDYKNHAINAV